MSKELKILCFCNKGNCRSVGTRYGLYNRGYMNVIALGGETSTEETRKMLTDWADIILLAKPEHIRYIPFWNQGKVNLDFTIGEDVYGHALNRNLQKLVSKQLDLIGLR